MAGLFFLELPRRQERQGSAFDRIYRMNRIDWGRGKMRRNEAILLFGNSQLFADEFAEGIS